MVENINEHGKKPSMKALLVALVFNVAALIFHIFGTVISASLAGVENPFVTVIAGIPFAFIAVLLYNLASASSGGLGILFMLVPFAFALTKISAGYDIALAAFLAALTPVVGSLLIYVMYKKGARKSTLCTAASVFMLFCELIRPFTDTAYAAHTLGQRLGTVLFERLGAIVDDTLGLIVSAFKAAAEMYPELESALTQGEQAIIKASLSLSLSLMPAILFCIFFALIFIVITITDAYNKRFGNIPNVGYGLYSVPHSVYVLFNIVTVLYILNLFFGSGISGYFVGITSAILFLMPHFLILAYRRIFFLLSRACGDFLAIVIILVVTAAGLFFSAQLFFWILAFFGTSEHRAYEFSQRGNDDSENFTDE